MWNQSQSFCFFDLELILIYSILFYSIFCSILNLKSCPPRNLPLSSATNFLSKISWGRSSIFVTIADHKRWSQFCKSPIFSIFSNVGIRCHVYNKSSCYEHLKASGTRKCSCKIFSMKTWFWCFWGEANLQIISINLWRRIAGGVSVKV